MAAVPHTPPSVPSTARLAPALRLVKAPEGSQVGTPVRVFALVLVVAALMGGAGLFLLGGPAESAAAPKVIVPYKDRKAAGAAPAKAAPAKAAPAPAKAKRAPAAAKAKPKPAPVVSKPDDGVPHKVSLALAKHPVVVVAVYSPDTTVAELARAEAQAGANAARVGFVALSAYAQKDVEELTASLGVISDPSVFVFTKGGTVVARIDGFVDADVVAQAAASAALGR